MSSREPHPPAKPASLLGRKFTPLSGAIRKRKKPLELQPLPADLIGPPVQEKQQSQGQSQRSLRSSSRRETSKQAEEELQIEAKVTKEKVSYDLLESGNPQSYIDFYYLTHGEMDSGGFTEDQLTELKVKLSKAEVSLRRGDAEDSILTYTDLGELFMNRKEFQSAAYFFDRCLEISRLHDLYEYEALAFKGIGDTFYNQGDINGSMKHYEDGLSIAETYDVKNAILNISQQLQSLYRLVADSLEEENQLDEALEYHEKCLHMCQTASDKVAEGDACFRIGLVYFNNEDYKQALSYQKKYHKLSVDENVADGITNSLAAIASTYQAMGNISLAIDTLEDLQQQAIASQNISAQAGASLNLGLLYHQQGSHKNSVESLEKHFNLARQLGDRGLVDAARVNLGVAQANCSIDMFVDVVSDNLPALLQWKNKRTKF